MDYIQRAIEKAREERRGKISGLSDNDDAKSIDRPAEHSAVRVAAADPAGDSFSGSIDYTETRVKAPDLQTLRDNRIVAGLPHVAEAEPYRQLRTQVLQKMRANNWRTLAITSPTVDAGKTLTAVNLAVSLSMEVNQTVLLVDLDLRNPGILRTFNIDTEHGLVDHLRGEVSVPDILVNPGYERLVILPGKADKNYTSEILTTPKMNELIADLVSRYDSRIILFDLPALLVNDDALVFTPYVDAALLVLEEGVTTPADINRSLQLLGSTNLLGTVMNKK